MPRLKWSGIQGSRRVTGQGYRPAGTSLVRDTGQQARHWSGIQGTRHVTGQGYRPAGTSLVREKDRRRVTRPEISTGQQALVARKGLVTG